MQGTQALTRATAHQIAMPPAGIDRTLWLYELCRFLISQCNTLIVGFLFDSPPCSASTCPEMRASEWQFLCAVHEQPKSCCAIDYCCHTLDWAANVVSDQNIFPSRFVILNDTQSKNVGLKNLVNVFRRLHRIFAHAWFQHRSVFWAVEGQSGLYVFFKTVCDLYDLLPAENYKLPPEAEGLEAREPEPEAKSPPVPTILKPESPPQQGAAGAADTGSDDSLQPHGRTTTRRHIRSSPSTGSAVTTVMETDEEETDAVTRGMNSMQLSAGPNLSQFADEPEIAEVPVIVKEASVEPNKAGSRDDEPVVTVAEAGPLEGTSEENETGSAVGEESAKRNEPATEASGLPTSTALAAPGDPATAPAAPAGDTTQATPEDGGEAEDKAETTAAAATATVMAGSAGQGQDTPASEGAGTETTGNAAPAGESTESSDVTGPAENSGSGEHISPTATTSSTTAAKEEVPSPAGTSTEEAA